MSRRLQQVIAWWFMLQIVVPFTAPLQTLDIRDLLGIKDHHTATSSPESTTTPTISDATAATATVSMIASTPIDRAPSSCAPHEPSAQSVRESTRDLLPGPQVQRSVLRL